MRGKLVEIKAAEPKIKPSPRTRAFRKGDSTAPCKKFQPTVNVPMSTFGATAFTNCYQHQQEPQGYLADYYSAYGTDNPYSTSTTAYGHAATHYYYYNYPQECVNAGYYYPPHLRQYLRPETQNAKTDASDNSESIRTRNQGTHDS